jgi:hypothetical protein
MGAFCSMPHFCGNPVFSATIFSRIHSIRWEGFQRKGAKAQGRKEDFAHAGRGRQTVNGEQGANFPS